MTVSIPVTMVCIKMQNDTQSYKTFCYESAGSKMTKKIYYILK